jgi:anti-sigma regulatory factor (Ser/Thr protein kinase)
MIHEIELPSKDTVQEWTKFIVSNYPIANGSDVNYNLKGISKLRPHHLVSWACLIEMHSKNVFNRTLSNANESVREYLLKMGFFEYFNRNVSRPIGIPHSQDKTTLSLWQLKSEMVSLYPLEAQKFYEQNAFIGQELDALNISLSEIFNNIIDHSDSADLGFTATQYYEKRNRLELAVCDFGVGIPNKINSFFNSLKKEILDQKDALRWAMQKGNSTNSTPKNRGFGLDTLSSLVKKLKGELKIITNKVILQQKEGKDFILYDMPDSFPGTLIVVTLDTSLLESKEKFSGNYEDLF